MEWKNQTLFIQFVRLGSHSSETFKVFSTRSVLQELMPNIRAFIHTIGHLCSDNLSPKDSDSMCSIWNDLEIEDPESVQGVGPENP